MELKDAFILARCFEYTHGHIEMVGIGRELSRLEIITGR
jgi:hypothetical protein